MPCPARDNINSKRILLAWKPENWLQQHLTCVGRSLLLMTGGALCSRSARAARLANSWSAPNLLPSSMSMLACTILLQHCSQRYSWQSQRHTDNLP